MGWLIVGIALLIIGFSIAIYEDFEDGSGVFILPGILITVILSIIIIDTSVNQYQDYQSHYETYVQISNRVESTETSIFDDDELMEDIKNYNDDIYEAKNEGFMTKFLHNKRLKDLDYIEIEGFIIDKED